MKVLVVQVIEDQEAGRAPKDTLEYADCLCFLQNVIYRCDLYLDLVSFQIICFGATRAAIQAIYQTFLMVSPGMARTCLQSFEATNIMNIFSHSRTVFQGTPNPSFTNESQAARRQER